MASAGVDHGREPCPDRVLDDIGGAFGMGAVGAPRGRTASLSSAWPRRRALTRRAARAGGGLWHLFKGVRNSPSNARFRGGFEVGRDRAACLLTSLPARAAGVGPVVAAGRGRAVAPAQAIRREAPRIGGSFAVWGGLFSTFDCTLVAVRRKVRQHV